MIYIPLKLAVFRNIDLSSFTVGNQLSERKADYKIPICGDRQFYIQEILKDLKSNGCNRVTRVFVWNWDMRHQIAGSPVEYEITPDNESYMTAHLYLQVAIDFE